MAARKQDGVASKDGDAHLTVGKREDIQTIVNRYKAGDTKPLNDLLKAFKKLKELPYADPNSFFSIGGLHGEPFQYREIDTPEHKLPLDESYLYWGGFCHHGNVLFPTWHRLYVYKLEKALQAQVPGVMMPYWNELGQDTLANGVPSIFTDDEVKIDGVSVANPLKSFTLPHGISDRLNDETDPNGGDQNRYRKPEGYETVRFPLSGLVGTKEDKAETKAHNEKYGPQATKMLNENVIKWFTTDHKWHGKLRASVRQKFHECMNAPNYTVFSNTTSAAFYNEQTETPNLIDMVGALESPHNDVHLAVGGYSDPHPETPQFFANGDMGENNTAGMDPIFYFHHCYIDLVFWAWQKRWGKTKELDIIPNYPGTSSMDSQGPTPTVRPGEPLTMKTPLLPFTRTEGTETVSFTSEDCVDIEGQLGYTYDDPAFELDPMDSLTVPRLVSAADPGSKYKISVKGLDRTQFAGSFIVKGFLEVDGERHYCGYHSFLNRWSSAGCANCRSNNITLFHFHLGHLDRALVEHPQAKPVIEIMAKEHAHRPYQVFEADTVSYTAAIVP